ncbi:MAG: hypothetical protein Q9M36_09530 [Sulfurovum sp.]|nr:hypothetical protein [Sulfurovum sp.]
MSDTQPHIVFLYQYFSIKEYYIPHPLWHYLVYITSLIFSISIEYSAVISSSALVTLWTYLVYSIAGKTLKIPQYLLVLITFSIIIMGPLNLPWYNIIIYMGQGSPNIWHNVTLWTVKPFALLTMFYILLAITEKKNTYYIFTTIFLTLSLFAKPSFVIMFLPALFIFAFIKKIKDTQFKIFFLILSFISIAVLAYQFTHTFHNGDSKVIFDFLGVWSEKSQNIAYSILLALAFPLLFLLLESKIIHENAILLSWLQVGMGLILYSSFAQTGKYYAHANFSWSYMIAMSLLYLFSIIKFFALYHVMNKLKRYLLLVLLSIQISIGIYYFLKMLQGQSPLWIAIFI